MATFHDWIDALRLAFPNVAAESRVDDRLTALLACGLESAGAAARSASPQIPYWGACRPIDVAAARESRVSESPQAEEDVVRCLVEHLSGSPQWGHSQALINVIPAPTTVSMVAGLLAMVCNGNLASEESSGQLAAAELEVTAMVADLCGMDPTQARGLFTFGGTGTLLYAVRLGIEKSLPDCATTGLRELPVIVCSEHAHHACMTVARWLGLGTENVVEIPTGPNCSMRPCLLESICRDLLRQGRKIACIVATLGTTDAFGLDDLSAIRDVRDQLVDDFRLEYSPLLHADAVIGWAWSVFNDYDVEQNPLEVPPDVISHLLAIRARMRDLPLADTIGADFHKTGFTAYSSSLFLVRDAGDFESLERHRAASPYLFQTGDYHPGQTTLETSRGAAGPLMALANLKLLGKDGLRSLLVHAMTISNSIRNALQATSQIRILNSANHGPVTLFRIYPDTTTYQRLRNGEFSDRALHSDFESITAFNRQVYERAVIAAQEGHGIAISFTDCVSLTEFGDPISALKAYALNPALTPDIGDRLVATLMSVIPSK
jgi:L-2,4-diaminobutyrate decarboxylase